MKKTFKSLFVIIAAMVAFAGCQKEETNDPATETKTVQFFAESIETKTAFGEPDGTTYPTLWTAGDKVKILVNLESIKNTEKTVTVDCSEDFKSASFNAELADPAPTDASYTFYSISPAAAMLGKTSEKLYVQIPFEQTPDDASVDKTAQLLYAASETTVGTMPVSAALHYKHLTAYGRMSLANLTSNVSSISSIKIEAPEDVYLAGKWDYFVEDGSFVVRSGNGSNVITLTTTKKSNIWFACAPVDVSGKTFTLTVTTDKGDLTKEITFPTGRKFESGHIAKFTVDMTGIEVEEEDDPVETTAYYEKVISDQDVADWSGKYLLVNETASKVLYAISNTSTKYGLGENVTIAKEEKRISAKNVPASYQIEISKATGIANAYAYVMKFAGKYLTWTSGNSLNVADSESENTQWSIYILKENAVISNVKDNNRKIYWNSSSPRFACYTSPQTPVQLYKYVGGSEGGDVSPEKTLVSIEVSGDAKNEYTVGDEFVKPTVTATYSDDSSSNVTTATFTGYDMDTAGDYEITVSYTENDVTVTTKYSITVKEAGETEIKKLTVAEFLEADVDDNVLYELEGTITSVANTSYGNFDLTDDTGTVYIYGLCSEDGATNKYWSTSGAKLGDDIVIRTIRADFNGTPQGKNARFVALTSPGTRAFYTLSTEAVDFASSGGEQIVTVTAYNTDAAVTASSDNAQFAVSVDGYVVTISSDANALEQKIEGNVTVKVGDLEATTIKVSLAAKPASGVVEGGQDDFNTILSTNTSYVSGKTTAGWEYTNCAIFKGGSSNSSPAFTMIGDATNRALCMNGKTSAKGTITSPILTTGCGTLKFNYGLPFSDNKIKFTVDIIQNGEIIKTFTVENSSAKKYTKDSFKESVNVSGEFQIVFKNLSPSNSTSNKDRTAIWDVEWTGCN